MKGSPNSLVVVVVDSLVVIVVSIVVVVVDFFVVVVVSNVVVLVLLLLLLNVKWVKVGINTTEGCATMVLSMFLCQHEATPRRRPGKNIVAMVVAIIGTRIDGLRCCGTANGEASASPFPTRERRHAAKRSRNLKMKA